jgi:hypothetical protein
MEIEQRHVVSSPHRQEMKLPAIAAELGVGYDKDVFDENRVKD